MSFALNLIKSVIGFDFAVGICLNLSMPIKKLADKKHKISERQVIMEEIKRLLLEEKAALLGDIREKTGKNKINSDIGDAIDSSVEEQERELDLLLQDREQARLKGIENALQRMESDDFGYCEECGEDISKKRLLAVPLTRMCINCQSTEERSRLAQNAFSRADYSSQVLSDE